MKFQCVASLVALCFLEAVVQVTSSQGPPQVPEPVPEQPQVPAASPPVPADPQPDTAEPGAQGEQPQRPEHPHGGPRGHGEHPQHPGHPRHPHGGPKGHGPRVRIDGQLPGFHLGLEGGHGHGGAGGQQSENIQIVLQFGVPSAELVQRLPPTVTQESRDVVVQIGISYGGKVTLVQLCAGLSKAGVESDQTTIILQVAVSIAVSGCGISGGIDAGGVGQTAVESVKKIIKLAMGILIDVLKELATFLKANLPKIADSLVTVLKALLDPIIDALTKSTPPILQTIGIIIAECPQKPEVSNSTSNATQPGAGGPQPRPPQGGAGPDTAEVPAHIIAAPTPEVVPE